MILILDKNDFLSKEKFEQKCVGKYLFDYLKIVDVFDSNDVLIFQNKSERILLKSAHETYDDAFYRNVLTDEWLEIFTK